MAPVLFADRGDHLLDPRPGDLFLGAPRWIERQTLDEIPVPKGARCPIAVFGIPADDRLVHEVVAKHRRAAAAGVCDGIPKSGLDSPPGALAEDIIPGRHLLFLVATQ